jgi:hypothetical protein
MRLHQKYFAETEYPCKLFADETFPFVYLFFNPVTKLSKVGITSNPNERIKHMICSVGTNIYNLIELRLQIDYDESAKYIEQYIHQYFYNKRTYGEWFNLSLIDMCDIRSLLWEIEGEEVSDNFEYFLSEYKKLI